MSQNMEIKFVRSREEDGCSLYDLLVGGKVIEKNLDMQQVIERISERDETLGERHTRAPEDSRRPFKKRGR